MSLFTKAKKTAPKTTKAKAEKVRITIEDSTFFDKITKLEALQDTMKSSKAKADMISDELRRQADNFIELDELKDVLGDPRLLDVVATLQHVGQRLLVEVHEDFLGEPVVSQVDGS